MQVQQLVFTAQQAMQTGRLEEAARLWSQVLSVSPGHPQALFHLGQHRLYSGNPKGALELLQSAANADPKNALIPLNISFAWRALADTPAELAALDQAVRTDPYCFPALLAKGAALQRIGKPRQAARVFRDALAIAPPDEHLPPEIRTTIARARDVIRENAAQLEAELTEKLKVLKAQHAEGQLDRFDEAASALIGTKKVYTQQPTLLHYPRLPAIPFYERKDFPWIAQVEAATDRIREELQSLVQGQANEFRPYLSQPMGAQAEYAPHWNAFFLWRDGKKVEENCVRCPETARMLDSLPLAQVPGAAPTAFFSALDPKSGIPPHTGVTNTRLIVHLPLVVPETCWFRVGNERREWRTGEALIFDDTIEHEAWNGSDHLRTLLIFDIWNPYLGDAERELVSALMATVLEYYRD
ncbi:MAG TPA: aspartyl/asparaginyl beta-hydroxylase domain-containing protein [Rhizomicrobium sp.]